MPAEADNRDGRAIPEKLGRGALAGQSLRRIVDDHPEDLMGRGWSGGYFSLLTKYIDASGMLSVHLHADDEPVE